MNLPRRTALFGAALLFAAPDAHAQAAGAASPIQALNQALVSAMRAGKATPFAQRYALIAPAVDRAFDLPAILQSAVGLRWASVPPAEQSQLLDAFRKFTIASYAANFDTYGGERIDVLPASRMVGADQVVETQIVAGDTTRIDYVMHNTGGGWKAIDVLLNGSISQVAVYRSDWRTLLARGANALVDSLQRRTADLSGGTVR